MYSKACEESGILDTIVDYITGRTLPDVGSEANRQKVERLLVHEKGFSKDEVRVDVPVTLRVAGEEYRSRIDLLVCLGQDRKGVMLIKCAAGSLGSREREAVAAARVCFDYVIPLAAATDGESAVVLDAATGRRLGSGLDAVPNRDRLLQEMTGFGFSPYPAERMEREKLIYRSYDAMNVNVDR